MVGSLAADGNGNITGGEEDYYDYFDTVGPASFIGSYLIGEDGRGVMELYNNYELGIPCQGNSCPTGYAYEQIIGFAVSSPSHSLVMGFDYSNTSTGTMDLQNTENFSLGAIDGGYSFTFYGADVTNAPPDLPAAFGGVFTANGAGGITGTMDQNDNGNVDTNMGISGNYSAPDPIYGRSMVTIGNFTYVLYVVDSTTLRYLETDASFTTLGSAFTQGSGSSFSGNYGFTGVGTDKPGPNAPPRSEGGVFNANGGSISNGVIDVNNAGALTNAGSFTGSYSISSGGRGTMTLSGTTGELSQFGIYVTENQGTLFLELDSGSVSAGSAMSQASNISASTFDGNYAADFSSQTPSGEVDLVGQITADGIGTLTGTGDINQYEEVKQSADQNLSGTFMANGVSDGRFPGTLESTPTGGLTEVYYVLSNNTVLFVEMDGNPAAGIMQLQNLTPQAKPTVRARN